MKTAGVSENERLEITSDSVIFNGVKFQTSEVKLTFYNRANKFKGRSRILFTAIFYFAIMAVILTSPIYTIFFNYMFFIYFPWGFSFLYLLYRIYMNYILEYVIVEFGTSKGKLFKVNNKKDSDLINSLKDKSFSVAYVEIGKGLKFG